MSVKQERVAQIILKDVTDIIQFSLKDPSVGFVTITDVQVTNDYSYATIYVCDIRMEVHRLHMLARLFRHRNKQGGIQSLFKLHIIFHLWQIMTTCCTRNMGTKFTNRWS